MAMFSAAPARTQRAEEAPTGASAAGPRQSRLTAISAMLNSPPRQRAAIARPVIQRSKIRVGDGEKEIADITVPEMDQLMLDQPPINLKVAKKIRRWIYARQFSHGETIKYLRQLEEWAAPQQDEADGRKRKVPRKRKTKKADPPILYDGDDSELSDVELDADAYHRTHPLSTAGAMNLSHVPSRDDKHRDPKIPISGLHHSDTFLMVKQGGSFVPRTINGAVNKGAHRKPLTEAKFVELAAIRDDPKSTEEARERANAQLVEGQRSLYFGNAIDWADDEYDAPMARKHANEREAIRKHEAPDAGVGRLMHRSSVGGLRSGTLAKTHTDAEQKLLASKVWRGLIGKLMAAIRQFRANEVHMGLVADRGIQLILNRSSCLGCGKALAVATVSFWKEVAEELELGEWRNAREAFAPARLFRLATPALYEQDKEKKTGFANIEVILRGLEDAGWIVEVPHGMQAADHARKGNRRLRKRARAQGSTLTAERSSTDGARADPLEMIGAEFEIGRASGSGNNCLLDTLRQVATGVRRTNRQAIATMRENLRLQGLAGIDDMIDLYGGAGAQLAAAFGIRIQAVQVLGGRIIPHPTLGVAGPLHYILHRGDHFSPLWPRDGHVAEDEAGEDELSEDVVPEDEDERVE